MVGSMVMTAAPRRAAICDFTNDDTRSPNAVEAITVRSAPYESAASEPVTGTPSTMTAVRSIVRKLANASAI